jgi:hypothetical protein
MNSTFRYAHDGLRLLFGWNPAGGESVVIKVTTRVPEHTDWNELMFNGSEATALFCEAPLRWKLMAKICDLKANQADNVNDEQRWRNRSMYYAQVGTNELQHQSERSRANRYGDMIEYTWPTR